jgi:hypothetical protein
MIRKKGLITLIVIAGLIFGLTFILRSHSNSCQAQARAITGKTVSPSTSRRLSRAGTSFRKMKSEFRKLALINSTATLGFRIK